MRATAVMAAGSLARVVSASSHAPAGGHAAVPAPPAPQQHVWPPPGWLIDGIPALCRAALWDDDAVTQPPSGGDAPPADEIADARCCTALRRLIDPDDDITRAAIYQAYKHGKIHALTGLWSVKLDTAKKLNLFLDAALCARAWAFARTLEQAGAQTTLPMAQINSSLREALTERSLPAVRLLLELGACASLVGKASTTPLLLALQTHDVNAVSAVLLAGAAVGGEALTFLFSLPKEVYLKLACAFARSGYLEDMWSIADQLGDGDLLMRLKDEHGALFPQEQGLFRKVAHRVQSTETSKLSKSIFNTQTLGLEPIHSIDPSLRIVIGGHFVFDIRELVQTIGAAHGALKNPYTGEFLSQADIAAVANHPSGLGSALHEVLSSNLQQYLGKKMLSEIMRLTQAVLREQDKVVQNRLSDTYRLLDTCSQQERLAVDRTVFVARDVDGQPSRHMFTIRSFLLELKQESSCSKMRLAFHLHQALSEHPLVAAT